MPAAARHSLTIGGLWSLARRPGRARAEQAVPGAPIDARQAQEIDALLDALDPADFRVAIRLSWRLCPLVERGVPPRRVQAAPVPRAARLLFADGTTVVVKGGQPGDLGVLAVAMRRGSVTTAACVTDFEGTTHLVFTWPGRRQGLSLRVIGLDQPD
jgi:enoyl-CoA hydratase/carnithine racemase